MQTPIREWTRAARKNLCRSITAFCFMLLLAFPAHAAISGAELDALQQKLIMAESSGNPMAIGDHGKSRGLMQIQEATWKRFSNESWAGAFNAETNVQVGRAILEHIASFQGAAATEASVALAYNTGDYRVRRLPKWAKHHPNKIYRAIFNV